LEIYHYFGRLIFHRNHDELRTSSDKKIRTLSAIKVTRGSPNIAYSMRNLFWNECHNFWAFTYANWPLRHAWTKSNWGSETANCLKLEKAWVTHHVNGFACKQTPIEICRNIVNKTCPRLSCLWKVFWSRVQSTNRLAWHTFLANVLTKKETKVTKIIVGL